MPSGGASLSICDTVSWNAAGPSVAHPQRLAVEHRLPSTGRRTHRLDDPRQRGVISLRLRV